MKRTSNTPNKQSCRSAVVDWAEQIWYQNHPLGIVLTPFSWLYGLIVGLRKRLYRYSQSHSKSKPFPIPIVVIGNITAGGTGKTPLVMELARILKHRYRVAIISRGYMANPPSAPYFATEQDDVAVIGDEAKMMFEKTGCPVVLDAKRRRAAERLAARGDVDVILADDGLQHLALPRALGVAVIDGERLFGNRKLLPAGPLRESLEALGEVDLRIINNREVKAIDSIPYKTYQMEMRPQRWRQFASGWFEEPDYFRGKAVHISTAIGNPQRFTKGLAELGVNADNTTLHLFPDHYQWSVEELDYQDSEPILMTEKDAARCDFLLSNPQGKAIADRIWVLESTLALDEEFTNKVIQCIEAYGH